MYRNYNRGGFIFPFLVGALSGGAAISLTRPRPVVYSNQPMYYPGMPYNYPYGYYY